MYNADKFGHIHKHRGRKKGKQETREEKDRQHSISESYLIGFPQPDVEGGFSEGVYGLLREHVLQADRAPS